MAKKILAMLLAAMMIVSIFAGCSNGGNDTSSEASTPAESSKTDGGEDSGDEESQEVKTLKVWQAYNWAWDKPGKEQDWDSYANCRAITEKIGIKLEYEVPVGEQDELLGPMIASNSLPDSLVLSHYSQNAYINQMIDAGMLYSFEELLETDYPDAYAQLRDSSAYLYHQHTDGKLYKFVGFESNEDKNNAFNACGIPATDGGSIFWARKDILEAFGKDDITTLEDYTDYLYFVKDNYPDVTPMQVNGNGYYTTLLWTFGVPMMAAGGGITKMCNITDDNQIEVILKNDNFIEFCKWMNQLCRDGVVSASQFTEQAQQANERQSAGGYGTFCVHSYYVNDNVNGPLTEAGKEDMTYVDIGPIQKEGIDFKLPALRDTGCLAWIVSKNIEDPSVAAKWFAYATYDDEINKLMTGGFEGTDYTMGEDGIPICSEEYVSSINANIEEFCTTTGQIAKFLPWISGPNWVYFVENPMAGKDANPWAYEVSIKRQGTQFITDVWEEGFVDLPNAIDPSSDAGIAMTKCNTTMQDTMVKLFVAASDAEFDQVLADGLAKLESDGVALYEEALNAEYQRQLELLGK